MSDEMIHVILFNLLFGCCLLYALKFGGGPERAVVLAEAAALFLTITAIHFLPQAADFSGLARALALIDLGLLAALAGIALRANRLWTIVLAGLQLSTVLVHVSKALVPALPAASYAIFEQLWAWPVLLTTAIGTQRHRARVRKCGEEQDWKPLWPYSVQPGSMS